MADFTVDIEGLTALSTNLDRGREQMGVALDRLRDVGPAPLGTAELDEACAGFHESWSYGLGKLGECIGTVRGGVDATRAAYAEVETALTNGFEGMRAALGQP